MKMKDVDQTHPHTDQSFWPTQFEPIVMPDGGRANNSVGAMETVTHTAPTAGADRSFERGFERGSEQGPGQDFGRGVGSEDSRDDE